MRLPLAFAAAVALTTVTAAGASAQVAPSSGGTVAPGDPQIATVQCLTRCISATSGVVKSKIRILGSDLGSTKVVSFPRADGKTAKDKRPVIKPTGVVLSKIPKRAVTGPIRIADSFGQVRDSSLQFVVGTKAQLKAAQAAWTFPIKGPHNYGDAGARFGSARSGHSHQGQDVFAACGAPLVAAHSGTVKARGYQGSAGNYVVIDGAGVKEDHVYMHLRGPAKVSKKQSVTTGQFLGRVGDSGNASGCHLHFEIWKGRGWYTGGSPIDPFPSLKYWDSFS